MSQQVSPMQHTAATARANSRHCAHDGSPRAASLAASNSMPQTHKAPRGWAACMCSQAWHARPPTHASLSDLSPCCAALSFLIMVALVWAWGRTVKRALKVTLGTSPLAPCACCTQQRTDAVSPVVGASLIPADSLRAASPPPAGPRAAALQPIQARLPETCCAHPCISTGLGMLACGLGPPAWPGRQLAAGGAPMPTFARAPSPHTASPMGVHAAPRFFPTHSHSRHDVHSQQDFHSRHAYPRGAGRRTSTSGCSSAPSHLSSPRCSSPSCC